MMIFASRGLAAVASSISIKERPRDMAEYVRETETERQRQRQTEKRGRRRGNLRYVTKTRENGLCNDAQIWLNCLIFTRR